MYARPTTHHDRMRFVLPYTQDTEASSCVGYNPELTAMLNAGDCRLTWMSPGAFLDYVDPAFRPDPGKLAERRAQAAAGLCFAPLTADTSRGELADGRYRAWVARELGISLVPVLIRHRPLRRRYVG